MKSNDSIRIVRFADEGFDLKEKREGTSFYDLEVDNYWNDYSIIREKDNINKGIYGCYSHFYKLNMINLKDRGILGFRKGHRINVGYLPIDYSVYARNMRPDGNKTRIVKVFRENENPFDKSVYLTQDDSYWDAYAWVKMKLSLLERRTEEYLQLNNTKIIPEHISEIFLTAKDIESLKNRKRIFFGFSMKYIPLSKRN